MPELPEVETICRDLERVLRGQKIVALEARLVKQIKNPLAEFKRGVIGAEILGVRRRAKLIIMDLKVVGRAGAVSAPRALAAKKQSELFAERTKNKSGVKSAGAHLIFHLRMTGQLIYRGVGNDLAGGGHPIKQDLEKLPNAYTHVIFNFADGGKLFFNDTRQFGFVKLVGTEELRALEDALGPEPLAKSFSAAKLAEIFKNRPRLEIKPALMEQKLIAGIGNIYASEICFVAGIAPMRLVGTLKAGDWEKIYQAMVEILNLAIKKRGTSSDTYVDAFGRQGSMNASLRVYGRTGQRCLRCGAALEAFTQKQRTTFWCKECQG